MSDHIPLVGGVLHNSGHFYLLVERDESDDDESAVAVGRAHAENIPLKILSESEEFISLIVLPMEWAAQGEAAALTAEGVVFFIDPYASRSEIVPGAGYSRADSRGVGRMVALREASGWLFAMGLGGQVYRRRVDSPWEDISLLLSSSLPRVFYTVAPGPVAGSFVFGGLSVGDYEETDEIVSADEAGDADRLADLILEAVEADASSICVYDRGWREVEFDADGEVGPIFFEEGLSWLIFVSTGTIWRTRDFLSFDEVFATDEPLVDWQDVARRNGEVFALDDNVLYLLADAGLTSFRPPLPTVRRPYLSISPSDAGLAAIQRDAVQLYDGAAWNRLVPVLT